MGPSISSESTSSNERLQKAIERNRAKQAAREAREKKSIELSQRENSKWSMPPDPPPTRENVDGVKVERNAPRRPFRSADNISFTTDAREMNKRPVRLAYRSTSTEGKKQKSILSSRLVLFAWAICFVFVLRLAFAERGMMDFYQRQKDVQQKNDEYRRVEMENRELSKEIEMIKNDLPFQRKLVRDNLGYIAQDEYLVMFAKE